MGRPKKAKTAVIYVRIPKILRDELREEAVRECLELSALVRKIIEQRVVSSR